MCNLWRKTLWILLFFIDTLFLKASDDKTWGQDCHIDCQCRVTSSSQTLIARWKESNSTAKTALCLITNETLLSNLELPKDIETVTFLQTNEDDILFTQELFEGLSDAKGIDIQGSLTSGMTKITNELFQDLVDLRYLSLQRVDITGAEKAFSKLAPLEVLYVIHCNVGYLKWEMLEGLKNLKELYFVQSGIKELYGFAFYGTPELRRLFLSHNDLFSVEADAFVGLLKLEYLDLSNNQIDHLSGLTFPPLPHLQWLELKHNPIKVIFPHCFQYLNGTQHLTLGHQKQPVHLMKFSFRGLFSLLYLHIPNIDNDALFEHMFYDLKSLAHLNLKGRIKVINNRAFTGPHKTLKKLVLHDCQLEKLFKDSFHGLENLLVLDLSENYLQHLPNEVFDDLKSVQQIKLDTNFLKQMTYDLFSSLANLKSLSLFKNPWICACQMNAWNESVIMSNFELTTDACSNTTCAETQMLYYEKSFMPKCKFTGAHREKNVFSVLKSMDCEEKLPSREFAYNKSTYQSNNFRL